MVRRRAQRALRASLRGRGAALSAALAALLLIAAPAPADAPGQRARRAQQAVTRADAAQDVLWRDFAGRGPDGVFGLHAPARPGGHDRVMYWWQAQVLDALLDRQQREPTAAGRRRVERLVTGVRRANGNTLARDYNDDMAWMALALLRADRMGIPTGHAVRRLWRSIRRGWNRAQGGGIAWRRSQPGYKNLPANGPAAILAAKLYARDHRARDLAWARQIVDYIHQHFVDPRTRRVIDGINRQGDGKADADWSFSYDVGLAVGADLALAQVTGYASLRRHALSVARANLPVIAPGGVLRDEGGGDGALFRGIAARYLVELGDPEVEAVLRRSAEDAWSNRNADGRFGDSWVQRAPSSTDLGAQVSGTMLLEQVTRMDRRG